MPKNKDKAKKIITNRVVGYGEQPASWFLANEENWQIHPLDQTQILTGVLETVGFVSGVIVNKRSGEEWEDRRGVETLVDGHDRVKIALAHGDDTPIPFQYVDLSPEEEHLVLATFDPIRQLAVADQKMLDALLEQTSSEDARVQQFLDSLRSDDKPTFPKGASRQEEAEQIATKWDVKLGQTWIIPSVNLPGRYHKVACGDCLDEALVQGLFGEQRAALMPTDPPYNIGADYGSDVTDNRDEEDFERFTRDWVRLWSKYADRQIVTPGFRYLNRYIQWFDPFYIAPWVKASTPIRGQVSRFSTMEYILMMGDDMEWLLFMGDGYKRKRQNDVFDYPIGGMNHAIGDHPHPKPLNLWKDIISSYTEEGDLVCDPFTGSGTTFVAAEQSARIAYGTDLSPRYVAITLERMQRECGCEPRLQS